MLRRLLAECDAWSLSAVDSHHLPLVGLSAHCTRVFDYVEIVALKWRWVEAASAALAASKRLVSRLTGIDLQKSRVSWAPYSRGRPGREKAVPKMVSPALFSSTLASRRLVPHNDRIQGLFSDNLKSIREPRSP